MNVKRTENDKYKKAQGSKNNIIKECWKKIYFFFVYNFQRFDPLEAIAATKASVGGFTAAITQCKNTLESAM